MSKQRFISLAQRTGCMLALCASCLAIATTAWAASAIDEGRAAYASGDYKTAIAKWQSLIDEGRAEGAFFLGVMYAEGKGVAQDHAKAHALYNEAAQKDYAPAQYNLGNQYANGEGVATRDFHKAEFWWIKAAERGLLPAQLNLGDFYYHGINGERNPAAARKWFALAAAQGSNEAKAMLAKLDAETSPIATRKPAVPPADETKTPTPSSTPTPSRADTLRREAWILAQPARHYTIQILATGTEAVAREFIQQHGLASNAAYVESQLQGNAVFRVVYGHYASREQAEKALAALPRALSANAPWVRSFAEVHKLVDRRHAERGAP